MEKLSTTDYAESLTKRFCYTRDLQDHILAQTKDRPVTEEDFEAEIEELNALVSPDKPSPAYLRQEKFINMGLQNTLSREFNLEALAADWCYLPDGDQHSLLERILKVQASLQSSWDITVKAAPLSIIQVKEGCRGAASFSLKDIEGKNDRIEIARYLTKKSLSETLKTLTHEQTHIYQTTLARAVATRAIRDDHPLFEDGLYFLLRDQTKSYVRSDIYSAYKAQRDEFDANVVGHAIRKFIARIEEKVGCNEEAITERRTNLTPAQGNEASAYSYKPA